MTNGQPESGQVQGQLRRRLAATFLLWFGLLPALTGAAEPDFSGVWLMIQHSRPGGAFFIPVEPPLTEHGKALTSAFAAKYDVVTLEANAHCVEPGMPTLMWGIGSSAMEIVQQPKRITVLSELANQSRRIYLDGRAMPDDFPDQRVGYSVGHWEGETLVVETQRITEWHAPRWPHSDQFSVVERWSLQDPAKIDLIGLRRGGPRPKVDGPVLVVEMVMRDPVFYANEEEAVTVIYRRDPTGALFEDNCSEYIWLEKLERDAQQRAAKR
ncbi:MAG: hypothetical protein IT494_04680 [Gammaproteobacteria bacterium]|nr:hypothetical protein [Gammaproteobacteria bacterium]